MTTTRRLSLGQWLALWAAFLVGLALWAAGLPYEFAAVAGLMAIVAVITLIER